jgi:hypothetical protein
MKSVRANRFCNLTLTLLLSLFFAACGSSGGGGGGGGCSSNPAACQTAPATPTGLTAAAGNAQVVLNWNASTGATSYKVGRSTTSGGPYTNIASPATNTYTDAVVTNGTTYYYVVAASNASGTGSNTAPVSATPAAASTAVNVNIDVMTDRHAISSYVYGGAFPKDAAHITDSNTSVVRWGGNGASTYNWNLKTSNADNDYYFEDFSWSALNSAADSDSVQFIKAIR